MPRDPDRTAPLSRRPVPPAGLEAWHRAHDARVTLVVDPAALPDLHAAWTGAFAAGDPRPAASLPALLAFAGGSVAQVTAEAARRSVVLLDRDGTIMEDRHYLADPAGVVLLPGAAAGLRALSAAGFRLVVLTNQSGVGRGLFTLDAVARVNQRLVELLRAEGVEVAGIYACPHTEADGCDCRKPAPGLAQAAARALHLDLGEAIVAGDRTSDLELARRLGVPGFLVLTGQGAATLESGTRAADYVVSDLQELARICTTPGGLVRPVA